ncbi:MAG: hypothetical protein M3Y76_13040 [Chloroflexota bacterium]|nr:hypothetical protein [Chloroflexota bacterium]
MSTRISFWLAWFAWVLYLVITLLTVLLTLKNAPSDRTILADSSRYRRFDPGDCRPLPALAQTHPAGD